MKTTVAQRKSPLTQHQRQVIATVVNKAEFDVTAKDVWTIRIDFEVNDVLWVHLYDGRQLSFNKNQFKTQVQALKEYARAERASECEVITHTATTFTVRNKTNGNTYTVEPQRYFANQRCNCQDCRRRGERCKHQVAVANWQSSLSEQLVTA